MFLADSNVLLDILTDDPLWGSWSKEAVRDAILLGAVGINPIIYAEISSGYGDSAALDACLEELDLARWSLPYEAAFLAGHAFVRYRRRGGARSSPLADFFIGAHAQTADLTVLTRDVSRLRSYFPSVRLISPTEH